MSRIQTVSVQRADEAGDDESSQRGGPNPLVMVHEIMRGRYKLALALMVIGGLAGAALGYKLAPPLYSSTSQIQVKPILPRILYETESTVMPRFDAFVDSQLLLMKSPQVVDAALSMPDWKENKVSHPSRSEIATGLANWRTKNGELLSIYMEHRNARVAYMMVYTVTKAYVDQFAKSDAASVAQRLEVLEKRRTEQLEQRETLFKEIHTIAQEYGSGSLEPIYEAKLAEMNKLDSELNRIRLAIAHLDSSMEVNGATAPAAPGNPAGAAPGGGGANGVAVAPGLVPPPGAVNAQLPVQAQQVPVTLEEAARESADVRQQLRMVREAEFDLTRMKGRLGDNHFEVVEKRRLLAQLQEGLNAAVKAYEMSRPNGIAPQTAAGELAILHSSQKRVQQLYDELKEDTVKLGRKQLQIDALRGEIETAQKRLEEVDRRIDQINLESAHAGRISVVNYGEKGNAPTKDRRDQFTLAGGAAGAGIGPVLLLLIGLLDPRFRSTNDARSKLRGSHRILGALPYLPDGMTDPEELASAAHSIHQIRVLLQVQGTREGHRVFALTSSSPGVGKTSIALALAYSFAGSSSRTLLIDLDLISGGLSARTRDLPRLGAPKLLSGTVGPSAMSSSSAAPSAGEVKFVTPPAHPSRGARKDDAAVTYLSPVEEMQFDGSIHAGIGAIEGATGGGVGSVDGSGSEVSRIMPAEEAGVHHGIPLGSTRRALAGGDDQATTRSSGLLDVLEGMPLSDCLTQTDEPNLSVLPLGGAGPEHVSRLSPEVLRRIIREARGRYDTVLIDTGPIMGSIEAAMIASEVDSVLMAVSRGEQRARTENAMEMVLSTGANIGGIIFNRAASVDVMMSGSSARSRSGFTEAAVKFNSAAERLARGGGAGGAGGHARSAHLGPLARAVVTSTHSDN